MSTDNPHRRNLTRERNQLRALHNARDYNRKTKLTYRGLTLQREPETESAAYELLEDDDVLGTIELDTFVNADDFVRYIDLVIQKGRERAQDWYHNELAGDWTQEADQ